jgi:uncharacterized protein YutE (UPF0331/DUF86 family)
VTPGHVDLKVVGDRLDIAREAIRELQLLPQSSLDEFIGDRRNIWAADALLRRAIEALFDAIRHLLAKGFGRGGLEYREVARLAIEHRVLEAIEGETVVRIAGYRNRLAHYYDAVTPAELYGILRSHLRDLEVVADDVQAAAARLATRDRSR